MSEEIDMLKMAGLSTTGVAILLIAYRVLKSIKGKKFISTCCGKRMEVGVDVADMTPREVVIMNPMPKLRTNQIEGTTESQ